MAPTEGRIRPGREVNDVIFGRTRAVLHREDQPLRTRTPCRVHRTYPRQRVIALMADAPLIIHRKRRKSPASTVHDRPVAGSVAVTTRCGPCLALCTRPTFPLTAKMICTWPLPGDTCVTPCDLAGDEAVIHVQMPSSNLEAARRDLHIAFDRQELTRSAAATAVAVSALLPARTFCPA